MRNAGLPDDGTSTFKISLFVRHVQKITVTDIKNFELDYRHSEEELMDLKQAYLDGDGDMEFILDSIPCCSLEDEQR